ncbi:MAG: tetratricopeptide repeat protein [Bacteroidetes bacterium]|nr:tetratricopeptide repeat protein [Bacteroidota bacterium]MBL6942927.1 tetratricopeptide repeat protein [Bacteroidales bacterium]
MAKKKNKEISGDQRLENIGETLSKTEEFIFNNQKIIGIVITIAIVAILGYFGYTRYYIAPKTAEAAEQMFHAQKYFEADSLDKALYGDGNSLGFIDIISEYSMTKPGNLANYYAGISFLKKNDFEQAIEYLGDFSADDHLVSPMATGAIGDAYLELGDKDKAAAYYLEAANLDDNGFTSPLFLYKAGQVYELLGNYDKAISIYNKIKTKYYKSNEGRSIEKNISRAKALQNQL